MAKVLLVPFREVGVVIRYIHYSFIIFVFTPRFCNTKRLSRKHQLPKKREA